MGKNGVHILMDTGSSHNFIDIKVAIKLGCKMLAKTPMIIKVANGEKLKCDKVVKNFQWQMRGVTFSTDVYLMPLGGCDLVLGVQWFSTLRNIEFNY